VFDFTNYLSKSVNGIVSISDVKLKRPAVADSDKYSLNFSNQPLNFDYKTNKYIIESDSILEIKYPNSDIKITVDVVG